MAPPSNIFAVFAGEDDDGSGDLDALVAKISPPPPMKPAEHARSEEVRGRGGRGGSYQGGAGRGRGRDSFYQDRSFENGNRIHGGENPDLDRFVGYNGGNRGRGGYGRGFGSREGRGVNEANGENHGSNGGNRGRGGYGRGFGSGEGCGVNEVNGENHGSNGGNRGRGGYGREFGSGDGRGQVLESANEANWENHESSDCGWIGGYNGGNRGRGGYGRGIGSGEGRGFRGGRGQRYVAVRRDGVHTGTVEGGDLSQKKEKSVDGKEETVAEDNNSGDGSRRGKTEITEAPKDVEPEKAKPETTEAPKDVEPEKAKPETTEAPKDAEPESAKPKRKKKKAKPGQVVPDKASEKLDEEVDNSMTFHEYQKVFREKRKTLEAQKVEERKVVVSEDFERMKRVEKKKEDIFVKLDSEKDKLKKKESLEEERLHKDSQKNKLKKTESLEKEEKLHKTVSINEFLKNYGRGRGGGRGRGLGRGSGEHSGGFSGRGRDTAPEPPITAPEPPITAPEASTGDRRDLERLFEDTKYFPNLPRS